MIVLTTCCRWFCHFDDDNYVNVPSLVDKLNQFDYRQDWYLGKPSLPEPLEILDRDNNKQVIIAFLHYLKSMCTLTCHQIIAGEVLVCNWRSGFLPIQVASLQNDAFDRRRTIRIRR